MKKLKINNIFIDKKVEYLPITKNIIKNSINIPVKFISDVEEIIKIYKYIPAKTGEKDLLVTENKGQITKLCQGIFKECICCNYNVINLGVGCPIECTYCFLQDYLNTSILTVYANIEKCFYEIDIIKSKEPKFFFRFGTGELTDSLVIDRLTGISKSLIKYFQKNSNSILELKTKTANIDHLLDYHSPNIVLSWSLNPDEIIKHEEYKSASLSERLNSAKKAQDAGFKIGLHFDPIINIPNWDKYYSEMINYIFSTLNHKNIIWISLGTLRYAPELKNKIVSRYPKTKIIYDEQVQTSYGKIRYLKPLRIEIYRKVYKLIREKSNEVLCYFCMEPKDVWDKVMGFSPKDNKDLDSIFTDSIKKRFPDIVMQVYQ